MYGKHTTLPLYLINGDIEQLSCQSNMKCINIEGIVVGNTVHGLCNSVMHILVLTQCMITGSPRL
jgi:hypothetical protein